jgi:hypothetical protein
MKKFFLAFLFLLPVFSFAQIEVTGGLGFLFIKQQGFVLNPNMYDPALLERTDVDRTLYTFGETMNAFYRIKYFSFLPGKITMGPQFGIGFYYTKLSKAIDKTYQPDPAASRFKKTFGPSHIPLEFAFHFGSLANPEHKGLGASLSAGIDLFYLHIADEKAFAALPCGTIGIMKGRVGFRLGFHFIKFRSVFDTNEGEVTRLSNSLTSFEFAWIF